MNITVWTIFYDFAVISVLLALSQAMRSNITILQRFMIPASLIAGILGWALGPNCLGVIPFSSVLGSYPGVLIVLIFAALPLGSKLSTVKKMGRDVGEMWNCVTLTIFSQYGWGMLFSIFALGALWQLHPGFGYMLGTGFFGGHGTAAAVATTFESYNWGEEARALGMASATVGILFAIIIGVVVNNIAVRKGWTHQKNAGYDKEMLTGLLAPESRKPIGTATISSSSLESLAFQFSLIMGTGLAGWYANKILKGIWPTIDAPTFCMALLAGYCLQGIMELTKTDTYIDRKTVNSLSGLCADYLVVAGISSIKMSIVVQYAVPFTLLMVFGLSLCLFIALYLGPKLFKEYWFERSMFIYGLATGSLVNGILLVRMIDPELKSKSLDTYAVVGLLDRPIIVILIALGPVFIATGYAIPFALICSGLAFVPLLVAKVAGWWNPGAPLVVQQHSESQKAMPLAETQ